jgi:hypothetical protein
MAVQAPALLAEVLAEQPVPQQAFPWKNAGWREMMHDLPAVLQVLNDLSERVDRSLVRKVQVEVTACMATQPLPFGRAGSRLDRLPNQQSLRLS